MFVFGTALRSGDQKEECLMNGCGVMRGGDGGEGRTLGADG